MGSVDETKGEAPTGTHLDDIFSSVPSTDEVQNAMSEFERYKINY